MSGIGTGIRTQARVIFALLIRDITAKHGPEVSGMAWLLVEPLLITIVVVGLHWSQTFGVGSTSAVSFEAILLTGYMPHLMLRHCGLSGLAALRGDAGLLYHQRVHFLDLVIARMLTEILATLVAFVILWLVFAWFGLMTFPRMLGWIYLGWFCHIWFIFNMGFIFTGLSLKYELARRLFQPTNLLLIVPYGAFFLIGWLPYYVRRIVVYFPCADATEMMRYGYFGTSVPTYFNTPYTFWSLTIMSVVALVILYRGRKNLEF
jgi:capsular polysaccharide transport system permease protein